MHLQMNRCLVRNVELWQKTEVQRFVVAADIKLEIQAGEGNDADPSPVAPNVYHPRNALIRAIKEWIPEFSKQKTVRRLQLQPECALKSVLSLGVGTHDKAAGRLNGSHADSGHQHL
jgi:hypothetical protein